MSEKKLIIASQNQGKIREIRRLLGDADITVLSMEEAGITDDVVEDRDSFEGNALKKAEEIFQKTQTPVLADDSGLCVDALNGEPGVYSARYAGSPKSDANNIKKLLENLSQTAPEKRTAHFVCCMVFLPEKDKEYIKKGTVDGLILDEQRGDNGFGYDPIFFVPAQNKTMAQLPMEVKNTLSHRSNALKQMIPTILDYFA